MELIDVIETQPLKIRKLSLTYATVNDALDYRAKSSYSACIHLSTKEE